MLLLEHTCDISRQAAVGTNGREQLGSIASSVPCLALPMDAQTAVQSGFSIGKAWEVYFDSGQDIKSGDQLLVNGRKLNVTGIQPFETPLVGHVRALCSEERM